MPFVFTVFFCGTGSNSFDTQNKNYPNGELVSTLASNHSGSEFVDWIIIDGPGSGNLQEDDKWVTPGNHNKTKATLTGAGWEENVAHAVAMIKGNYEWSRSKLTAEEVKILQSQGVPIDNPQALGPWFWRTYDYPNRKVTPQELQMQKAKIMRKGKMPDVVNLIGWSRGGVTCHMLANAIYNDPALRNIRVNIFAIDPVPGIGNFQAHRTSIPANIDNYVAVYARDERSFGFSPSVPSFPSQMRVKPIVLPLPGRHATLVGNGAVNGGSGTQDAELLAPGKLVRHLAEEYLTAWGTPLQKRLNLSLKDVESLYDSMVANSAKYIAMRSHTYTIEQVQGKERKVGKGSDLLSTYFPDIKGTEYLHPEGLAPVNGYLSWHHKQIKTLVTPPVAQQQSVDRLFPHFAFGLTYSFSNEPILLNGMKVIFDQPVGLYPVNLESKEEARRNGA
ncbi:hypothetical protein RIVM261_033190 [Rivularia sp. IAM M-261]|nr:hypothetical protein CAL7716_093100 [Calothrix sp. PCC 7716]GJD18363.1 hypothetical protein RIVM261_033190 [Rivularia sp. IAM M-261]